MLTELTEGNAQTLRERLEGAEEMLETVDGLRGGSDDPGRFVTTVLGLRTRLEGLKEGVATDAKAFELPEKEWADKFRLIESTLNSLSAQKKGFKNLLAKKVAVAAPREPEKVGTHRRLGSRGSFIDELQNATAANHRFVLTRTPKSVAKMPPKTGNTPGGGRDDQYRLPTIY